MVRYLGHLDSLGLGHENRLKSWVGWNLNFAGTLTLSLMRFLMAFPISSKQSQGQYLRLATTKFRIISALLVRTMA
jgi:hypothetical protein